MLQAMIQAMPGAARVTEQLVAQLGAERICKIQPLSEHIYRAVLNDGAVALAMVMEDGNICVLELEAVW